MRGTIPPSFGLMKAHSEEVMGLLREAGVAGAKIGVDLAETAMMFALQEAGVFALVLEGVPAELARRVTAELEIPTIGIGAGPSCDGQVLVWHDVLGLTEDPVPRFVRRYERLGERIADALRRFGTDVREGRFPSDAESYHAPRRAVS